MVGGGALIIEPFKVYCAISLVVVSGNNVQQGSLSNVNTVLTIR